MSEKRPVHRLKIDNRSQQRRYAICGAVEDSRRGERLDFTIDPDDVTCGPCDPIDTGALCPARTAWWHMWSHEHAPAFIGSVDCGNCRRGPCVHCGRSLQQRLYYGGKPAGPWLDEVWLPCAHGVGGVPLSACMACACARSDRGLYQ